MAEDFENNADSVGNGNEQNIRHFKIDSAQIPDMPFKIKLPSVQVPTNMDYLNKMAQDAANAIKKAESLSSALKISEDLSEKLTNPTSGAAALFIKQSSPPATSTSAFAKFLAESAPSFTFAFQPQVFAALQKTAKEQAKTIARTMAPGLKTAIRPLTERRQYVDRLTQTHWPLFLVGGTDLYHEVLALDDELDDATLQNEIDRIAEKYLDDDWFETIQSEWSTVIVIDDERRESLLEALDDYKNKQYKATTSTLMCLFNSFYENYKFKSFELTNEAREAYDYLAGEHNLNKYAATKKKEQNIKQGEKLLYMFILSDRGWDPWAGLLSYIVDVTVSSDAKDKDKKDEKLSKELLDHNPNRNKICHGEQVSYGTWEHAVKSILVTDAILCLNGLFQKSDSYQLLESDSN